MQILLLILVALFISDIIYCNLIIEKFERGRTTINLLCNHILVRQFYGTALEFVVTNRVRY